MFDLGWSELLIVATIAVIIVGPNEMPRVVRSVTAGVRKVREMAFDFQSSMEDIANDSDIEKIKDEMLNSELNLKTMLDKQLGDVADIKKIGQDLDNDVNKSLDDIANETPAGDPAPKKSKTKKTSVKKSAVKKSAVKKSAVKKSAVKKSAVKKSAVKKSAVKKSAVKKSAVKKSAVKKSAVKKSAVKKS